MTNPSFFPMTVLLFHGKTRNLPVEESLRWCKKTPHSRFSRNMWPPSRPGKLRDKITEPPGWHLYRISLAIAIFTRRYRSGRVGYTTTCRDPMKRTWAMIFLRIHVNRIWQGSINGRFASWAHPPKEVFHNIANLVNRGPQSLAMRELAYSI